MVHFMVHFMGFHYFSFHLPMGHEKVAVSSIVVAAFLAGGIVGGFIAKARAGRKYGNPSKEVQFGEGAMFAMSSV